MLSLYNSLGLDGASGANGNRLLVISNDIQGSFPTYSTTTLSTGVDTDPNENDGGDDDPVVVDNSAADINRDGIVDGSDLTFLLADFGLNVNSAATPRSDINRDDIIDGADLTFLLANWGQQFSDFGVAPGGDPPSDDGSPDYDVRPDLGVRPRPDGEDDGGGEPNDPPIVGVVETINGLVYPTSRVNVSTSPALPAWIKERNV
jgi:hypothetical protein